MEKTEKETKIQKPIPLVKSPSKDKHLRKGKGFSLGEIKKAGKNVPLLKEFNIQIDYFRRSVRDENVEKLKKLKLPEKKKKKRAPFVRKEKRIRVRTKPAEKKPKPKKKEEKPPKEKVKAPKKEKVKPKKKGIPPIKEEVKKPVEAKPAPEPEKKEEALEPAEEPPIIEKKPKKKARKEKKGTPLTELDGLGPATESKFKEMGVNNIEELLEEDPEELGTLISGVTAERVNNWIKEAKELLKK
ncbi:MAG: hypothetical protein EU539_02925 [Promethearchaeota archaeon]|nr:MAG: hypothetical protein EU539_02925 [Candidatus Lokiarchaeota archaeon]